jgi:hypothetical protein
MYFFSVPYFLLPILFHNYEIYFVELLKPDKKNLLARLTLNVDIYKISIHILIQQRRNCQHFSHSFNQPSYLKFLPSLRTN